MAEKRKLGRGLDSIFGGNVEEVLDQIEENAKEMPGRREVEINVDEIRPNPYQPRKEFDQKGLEELAASIKEHGIFTPLLVRKSIKGYDLITGERRLRAAKMAGLDKVPAIEVDFKDDEMMEIALLENVQREDLNPIEEAMAYDALVQKLGYTQEKLAERVGKSREYCANMMRLLKLPESVRKMVIDKKLTAGHVRPLLALKDEEEMEEAAREIYAKHMSVRETEKYVKGITSGENPVHKPKKVRQQDPYYADIENRMSEKYGTQVEVSKKEIRIHYSDTEDLNRILEMLGCIEESSQE